MIRIGDTVEYFSNGGYGSRARKYDALVVGVTPKSAKITFTDPETGKFHERWVTIDNVQKKTEAVRNEC